MLLHWNTLFFASFAVEDPKNDIIADLIQVWKLTTEDLVATCGQPRPISITKRHFILYCLDFILL